MGSSNVDVKFDFVPWDGTPGDDYDSFQIRLMNNANKSATTVAGRSRTRSTTRLLSRFQINWWQKKNWWQKENLDK